MKKVIGITILTAQVLAVGCAARVAVVPPPPRYEVVGVAPRRNAVWVQGHWHRRFGQWVWVRGYWR
jgi:hypothetical protein